MKHMESELTHASAHYLLVIHSLKDTKGYARVTDISKELGISKGSVSITLNSLKNKGLVKEESDSKFLLLTERGHKEIHKILANRELFFTLFRDVLGAPANTALAAACEIEHLIAPAIGEKLFEFLKGAASPSNSKMKRILIKNIEGFKTDLELESFQSLDEFTKARKSEF